MAPVAQTPAHWWVPSSLSLRTAAPVGSLGWTPGTPGGPSNLHTGHRAGSGCRQGCELPQLGCPLASDISSVTLTQTHGPVLGAPPPQSASEGPVPRPSSGRGTPSGPSRPSLTQPHSTPRDNHFVSVAGTTLSGFVRRRFVTEKTHRVCGFLVY